MRRTMTTKERVDYVVKELNTKGSRYTLNGNDNHISYYESEWSKGYIILKDGEQISPPIKTLKGVEYVLETLCHIL